MYLKNKDAIINFRVASRMRDYLIEFAKRHGMSISAYLRYVLSYHLSLEKYTRDTDLGVNDMYEDK